MTLLLDVFLPALVIFIMTIVGMDLRLADFLRVRRHPLLVPAIVAGQWIAATVVGQLAMATFGAVRFAVHLATMMPLALWSGRSNGTHGAACRGWGGRSEFARPPRQVFGRGTLVAPMPPCMSAPSVKEKRWKESRCRSRNPWRRNSTR